MSDLDRLKDYYARQMNEERSNRLYSLARPHSLFFHQGRQQKLIKLLDKHGLFPLRDARVLEMGCADGDALKDFLHYGVAAKNLHGIDIRHNAVERLYQQIPSVRVACASGKHLPYSDSSFDIVMQFTAFSSMLDDDLRREVAQEMQRVCRPEGIIIWYDFWINPTNRNVEGIGKRKVLEYFDGWQAQVQRITLAPPIARRIAPISITLCRILEKFQVLNTHYLVVLRPMSA